MGAPDVLGKPTELLQVLDGRAVVELAAVVLLLGGFREMGVESQADSSSQVGRNTHEILRDGERRTRSDRDLNASTRTFFVQLCKLHRLFNNTIETLHEFVRRQPTVRLAEVHRAAGGNNAHAELPCGAHFCLDQARSATGKDVVVVEDGAAAGEREL